MAAVGVRDTGSAVRQCGVAAGVAGMQGGGRIADADTDGLSVARLRFKGRLKPIGDFQTASVIRSLIREFVGVFGFPVVDNIHDKITMLWVKFDKTQTGFFGISEELAFGNINPIPFIITVINSYHTLFKMVF
ncbi:hypothetical protein CGZ77_01880 [Neisseria sp. KEM232]|nr:hypothetical protein CGZ77_01880 [Neisseria sp. KEM232]